MKKVLLATTALVATAGFAAADITITGSANMGLKYQEDRASVAAAATASGVNGATADAAAVVDNNDNDTIIHNEIDFNIVASGTSDSGVEFGASVDLDASEADQRDSQSGSGANDPEVYVSYNGLTVTVGAVGNAGVVLTLPGVGFDGLNADTHVDLLDDNGAADNMGADMDVHASYTISGVTVAASVGSDSEDFGASVSGELSGVSFGLGYYEDGATGSKAKLTSVALGYTMGAVSVNAMMIDGEDAAGADVTGYGLAVSYTSGAMTVVASYSDNDDSATSQIAKGTDAADAAYGIGVAYDLGGGLAVKGGVGSVASKTVADLGLTMSF